MSSAFLQITHCEKCISDAPQQNYRENNANRIFYQTITYQAAFISKRYYEILYLGCRALRVLAKTIKVTSIFLLPTDLWQCLPASLRQRVYFEQAIQMIRLLNCSRDGSPNAKAITFHFNRNSSFFLAHFILHAKLQQHVGQIICFWTKFEYAYWSLWCNMLKWYFILLFHALKYFIYTMMLSMYTKLLLRKF